MYLASVVKRVTSDCNSKDHSRKYGGKSSSGFDGDGIMDSR